MYRRKRRNGRFFHNKKQKPRKPEPKVAEEKEKKVEISSSSSESEEETIVHPYSSLVASLHESELESSSSEEETLRTKRQKVEDSDEDSAASASDEVADRSTNGNNLPAEDGQDDQEEAVSSKLQEDDIAPVDQQGPGDLISETSDLDDENQEEDGESDVLVEEDEYEEEEVADSVPGQPEVIMTDDEDDGDEDLKAKGQEIPDVYKHHFDKDISDLVKVLEKSKPQIFESAEWPTLRRLKYTCRVDQCDTTGLCHPHIPFRPISNPNSKELQKVHRIRRYIVNNWAQQKFGSQTGQLDADLSDDDNAKMFTPLQKELFTLFSSYGDVLYCDKNTVKNSAEIQRTYCLHAVNHVLRAKTKVFAHTAKLKQLTPEQCESVEYRDQGITRPRVLILLPFRETALRVVSVMIELLQRGKKFQIGSKHRFKQEFGKSEEDEDHGEEQRLRRKPEDFQRLFAGNVDEHFRIGIAVLQNSVRLYVPFYASDIIVASPLGIRTVMGAEGESHYEHDFLSSVEMVILDHTDVFLMQNWEHILHILEHLNLTPKESHGADFSRVRNSSLDGLCKYYRQTIAVSTVLLPQISSLFTKFCWNYKGAVSSNQMEEKGTICEIAKQLPMVFHKLSQSSLVDAADVRFRFFVDRIYRQYNNASMSHTVIYIAQYFDFVRLRNFMRKEQNAGAGPVFTDINDYSNPRETARARRRFSSGKCHLLLYTERHHFYNRTRIRGMRNLVFYELPSQPHFFADMCGMVRENFGAGGPASSGSVLVMYSRHDARKLAAVVGIARCKELLSSSKSVHMFVTGATTGS